MTEEKRKQIEEEYRMIRRGILEKRDAELEKLRKEKESKKRVYRQERRALLWGIQHSDGEYVKIPLSVAQTIRKDLEALNSVRQAVHKLER